MMQINLAFDPSAATASGAFISDVQAVAAYFDRQITNNIAVTITVGYGDIDGTPLYVGALGESESQPASYSYSQVRAALVASASSASDISAIAALPANPSSGQSTILVPQVEAGVLGLGGPGMSGHVGFSSTAAWDYSTDSTDAADYSFTGAVAHEISEVLGRVSYYGDSPLDLFRYSGPNQSNPFVVDPNYFSVDSGTTDLADFNTQFSGDLGDWASSVPNDASDAFATRGQLSVVTPVDLVVLDTLGYTLANPARPLTIAGTVASQPVSVRGSIGLFAGVTLSDPNAGRIDTATVRLSSPYEGGFSNLAGGSFNQAAGTYAVSGMPGAVQNALDGLVFVPNAAATLADQTTQTSVTLAVSDGLASASDSTTSVVVTGIGTIVITGSLSRQTVPTPGLIAPFAGVVIADPNVGQTETLTITPSYAGHGSFVDLGGGTYDAASGVYTVVGSLAVVQRSLAGLMFTPSLAAVRTGNGGTGFTIKVDDGLVSSADIATTVIAAPPIPPTISGTVSGQTVVASGAIAPFANVSIADANAGVTGTLTVTSSAPSDGVLGNTAGGAYDATRGVYTVSGSFAAITAALDELVFAPNEAASSDYTSFAISLDDGVASAVNDSTTSVTAVTVASPLPDMASVLSPLGRLSLSQALAAITPAGATPHVVTVQGGMAAPAPVAGTLDALVVAVAGSSIALPAGYQAAYLLGANDVATDANGNTLIVVPANGDTVFAAAGDTVIGGNGAATISAGGGAETLVGGTGANLFALGTGADRVISQGVDTIIGSSGSATVTASSAPLYFGGAGPLDFIATGGLPTLVGGGAETVNAGAAAALVFGGSGPLAFAEGSGAGTVVGGAQSAVSLAGGAAPLLFFGNGTASYTPGSAVDTILGGTGSLTATGGANGTLFFGGSAGGNMIATGAGATTIIGGGNGDVLTADGPGANVIGASGGAETINAAAATGADVLFAGNGADCLVGGAGTTAMVAGVGNDTLVAGSGSTLFLFFDAGVARTEIVTGFNAGMDFVQLAGYAPGAAATAIGAATQSDGGTAIALPDGTQIIFQGVANVAASSFL